MKLSLVVSTRDNIDYLKWSYNSIRKNQGNHEVWICYGIDHCTDGTQKWIEEIKKTDPFVKSIENISGRRLGHTIIYDRIINEIVDTDLAMIFHSDMYLCPNALDAIEELMYAPESFEIAPDDWVEQLIEIPNRIVSLTRIEPSLHPQGPEKIIKDFGTEPENFDEVQLLQFANRFSTEVKIHGWRIDKNLDEKHCTSGIFAPWCFWVDEFKEIGGHDKLYAPQSKEDSDFFNRFKLKFGETCFKQTWIGYVYHFTSRGSRYNPNLTTVGTNSSEWEIQNLKSTRNFIRKWGHFVKHTELLHPIVPHRYNIGFKITNCYSQLLNTLEPWCDSVICDLHPVDISKYVKEEQPNTTYCDLNLKINPKGSYKIPDIIIEIDGKTFSQEDMTYLMSISEILTDSGEAGTMKLGNLTLHINALTHYENELIVCKNGQ